MSLKNVPIPEAAKAAGMTKLVLEDDFDNYDTIDMSGEGKPGYHWYADRPYGNSTLTFDEVVVKDSVLTLKPETCGAAVTLPSYSRKGKTGFTYHFGYAEAKIRFPVDNLPPAKHGQIPAFWGLGVDDVAGRPWYRLGELDILEAIRGNMETNMSASDMTSLVKMQLETMPSWDIEKTALKGKNDFQNCYALGFAAAVVNQDHEQIARTADKITTIMNNQ